MRHYALALCDLLHITYVLKAHFDFFTVRCRFHFKTPVMQHTVVKYTQVAIQCISRTYLFSTALMLHLMRYNIYFLFFNYPLYSF